MTPRPASRLYGHTSLRASTPDEEARRALGLLIRVRFVHIALQILLLYPALRFGWMFPSDLPWAITTLALLLAFNLAAMAWQRAGRPASPAFLLLQVAADLTAITLLFGLAGGLTHPAHSLIHFVIGYAGLLLPPGAALAALALGMISLLALASSAQSLADPYAWIGPLGPNLAYEWLLAGVVAALAIFAAGRAREYRERLEEARERLRQQDRLRAAGAVASGFCHELASPLNAAALLADRLKRKTVPAAGDVSSEWAELRESLGRCERIVRNMAGAPWDPGDIAIQRTDVLLMLRKISAEWKGAATLDLSIPDPDADLTVLAPPVGLGQAVMNLLRNAEEASPKGGTIDIGLSVRGPFVEISVSDRGPGVDPGVLNALGTPFNSRKGEGRGLGLFAALHFTESLGGALTLEARPAGGAIARLTFPRAAVPGEDA